MTDPCSCDTTCPHGERCHGGHANYPDRHWYPCETCSPPSADLYPLRWGGQVVAVVRDCRHAVGPGRPRDVSLEIARHWRGCASG